MSTDNIIKEKTDDFALRIVKLYNYLKSTHKEFILSNQILRSGTSIGANVTESKYAQSLPDFISKHSIALKEAGETEYWLSLLYKSEYLTEAEYKSIHEDIDEIIKVLSSIIISSKQKLEKEKTKKIKPNKELEL